MLRVPTPESLLPLTKCISEDGQGGGLPSKEPTEEELPPPPSYEESKPCDPMSSYNSNPISPPAQQSSSRVPPSAVHAMFVRQHQNIDIISIDELDLSNLSSDENIEVSPLPGLSGLTGLKQSAHKLLTQCDFKFVQ